MPRIARVSVGNQIYHILNRANAKAQIFENDKDYQLFESILEEAREKFDMRILSYCLMPNHWHLVLYPKNEGTMSLFMGWLTMTHTQRWHVRKGTVGQGHVYQGRYKSFLCQDDNHFLTLTRYVERNALKSNLVKRAENWRWSSLWRRENGTDKQKQLLSAWPVEEPRGYIKWINEPQNEEEEKVLDKSLVKSSPYGTESWVSRIVKKFKLESTLKERGRPKKGS